MFVSWQSDLVNTKESVLPVCDQPYHTKKEKYRMGRRLKFCGTVHCLSDVSADWKKTLPYPFLSLKTATLTLLN